MTEQRTQQTFTYYGFRMAGVNTVQVSMGEGGVYEDQNYTPRPYADVTRANWDDCLYCGGLPAAGPCQYNHVEARENGDARRVLSRPTFETVVDCPIGDETSPVHKRLQRFTTRELYAPLTNLRKGV
jgi:hypothetical protein